MTQFNLELLHTLLTKQWQIDIKHIKEIRNSQKIMLEVTAENDVTYLFKGEKANAATVENIIHFAASLSPLLPVATYI